MGDTEAREMRERGERVRARPLRTPRLGDALLNVPPSYQSKSVTSGRGITVAVNPVTYGSLPVSASFPQAENIGTCDGQSGGVYAGTVGTTLTFRTLCAGDNVTIEAGTGGALIISAAGAGTFFAQGGNSFGATAVLGTNDNHPLSIVTDGITAATVGTNQSVSFANAISAGVNGTAGGSLALRGSGTGSVTIGVPATVAVPYSLTLPAAQGAANSFLTNNGSGGLSWTTSAGNAFLVGGNSVSGTAVLGTLNAFALDIVTNGSTAISISTSQAATFSSNVAVQGGTATLGVASSVGGVLVFESGSSGGSLTMNVPASVTSYAITWPGAVSAVAAGYLTSNTSGTLSWTNPNSATGFFLQGGNSFGTTATLGTNDSNPLVLKANGTTAVTISTTRAVTFASTATVQGGALTLGVANTTSGSLVFDCNGGAGTLTMTVPASITTYTITWPAAVAAGNNYVLTSTTGGVLAWAAQTGPTGTNNTLAYFNGSGALASNANITVTSSGVLQLVPVAFSSASLGTTGALFASAGTTVTDNSGTGGTIATVETFASIAQSTLTATVATTYTTAATLYIAGPPLAGAPAVITNAYSLYVSSGPVYFANNLTVANNATVANNIVLSGGSTSGGLFSTNANNSTGGVFFNSAAGNLIFQGGTTGNFWTVVDSNGSPCFEVANHGTAGPVGVNNGALTVATSITAGSASAAGSLVLDSIGGVNGLTQTVPVISSSYTIIWPAAQAAANGTLRNDGSGNLSWSVANTSQGTLTSQASTTSATFVTTGLSAAITPRSTASKVMITVTGNCCGQGGGLSDYAAFTIFRGATNLGSTAGFTTVSNSVTNGKPIPLSIAWLDSPATTSATTYALYFFATAGTGYLNFNANVTCAITLTEVFA